MKDFIEFIVKHLVNNPESAVIEETIIDNKPVIIIKVQPEDVGKVIGKKGLNINSIRTLVNAIAARENKYIRLEVFDQRKKENEGK